MSGSHVLFSRLLLCEEMLKGDVAVEPIVENNF